MIRVFVPNRMNDAFKMLLKQNGYTIGNSHISTSTFHLIYEIIPEKLQASCFLTMDNSLRGMSVDDFTDLFL